MRANTFDLNRPTRVTLEITYIEYALLGCLRYTLQTDKLTEMLLYILTCSSILAEHLQKQMYMFNIIDCMVETVGPDYDNGRGYMPAIVFSRLGRDTRLILFRYMTETDFDEKRDDLCIAKERLIEQLVQFEHDECALFVEAEEFLFGLYRYLKCRLSEITIRLMLTVKAKNNPLDN